MMNNRIKELAEQAGFVVGERYVSPDYQVYDSEYMQKFAELIVQDCIQEIEGQYGGGPEMEDGTHSREWDQAIECVSAMVRHHFGVGR